MKQLTTTKTAKCEFDSDTEGSVLNIYGVFIYLAESANFIHSLFVRDYSLDLYHQCF